MIEPTWQKKKVAKILQSLAAAYLANRQYDNAVEKFLQLKSLGDDDPSTSLGLAGAFLGLKKTTPEALHAYRQFCETFPEDAGLISNIAELLLQNEARSEEALHIYRCAIAFHPPFEKDLHLVLLEALEQRGDIPLALQAARSAALLPGSDAAAIGKLVSLSWRQKRFDELVQDLKMLAEHPASRDEVRLYAALTLAYRAFHNNATLSAKDLKTVKQASSSLLPVKSLAHARDYCALQFAVARSERPQAVLVEEKEGLAAKLGAGATGAYFDDASPASLAKKPPHGFFDDLIYHSDGENERRNPGEIKSDGVFAGQARAVMVVAAASQAGEAIMPQAAGPDDWLRALFADLEIHTEQIRRLDDGLIAVARSPQRLVEMITGSLKRLSQENFSAPRRRAQPSILIHALAEGAADDPGQSLALFNTALQLMGNLSQLQQLENRHVAAPKAKLYLTSDALDAFSRDENLAVSQRQTCVAGALGTEVEIGEVLWQDPFDLAGDKSPIQVGRFAVVSKIRSASTCATFVARDHKLGVTAILKSFSPGGATDFDESAFVQVIRRVGKLTHPSVALIYDMGKRDGIFYFVREFVEGHSLADEACFANAPSPARVISLGMQLCRALHAAHREGVLHLNLKPANCWITPEGKIKITDFAIPDFPNAVFMENRAEGENIYIAPELGETFTSSPASDVYSVAALLFLMLSHLPAPPLDDDFFESLDLPPDQRIPQPLKDVLFGAVAHDPLSRPQSMAEFERQLRDCQMALPPSEM